MAKLPPTAEAQALVDTHLGMLGAWRQVTGLNGNRIIDDSPLNEYAYWQALCAHALRHEVVLTNQIFASAEYSDNAIHSALRGGISNGFTNSAAHTQSGLTSVVSVFPFLTQDPVAKRLRDGNFENTQAHNAAIAMPWYTSWDINYWAWGIPTRTTHAL